MLIIHSMMERRERYLDIQRKLLQISRDKSLPVLGVTVKQDSLNIIANTKNHTILWFWYYDGSKEPIVKDEKCLFNGRNGTWYLNDLPEPVEDVKLLMKTLQILVETYYEELQT